MIEDTVRRRRRLRPHITIMRVLGEDEARRLAVHVLDQAKELSVDGSPVGQTAALDDFVRFRFEAPLREDAAAGPSYSKAFTGISVLTIIAGLASSVVANSGWPAQKVVIGILGLAVGGLTALNQIWNPSRRSVARYQAAYALRREGWNFVHARGRYALLPPGARLEAFVDEVGRIHRGVELIDELASSGHAATDESR